MHIVIISEDVYLGTELVSIFATCKWVKQISYIDTTEELFDLKESTPIDVIFIFLEQSSEHSAALFTEIQDNLPELNRKLVIISSLAENLSKNHMLENVLSFPVEPEAVLKMIDDFYVENEE